MHHKRKLMNNNCVIPYLNPTNSIKLRYMDNLINLEGLTPGMLVTLGEQKILNLNDFADLASDELIGGYDIVKGERIKIKGAL